MRTRLMLALMCSLSAMSAAGETTIYRWTDAEGKLNYSDQPPGSEAASTVDTVDVRTARDAYTAQRLERLQRESVERAEQRASAREEAAESEREAERVAEYCRTARERLETLRQSRRPQFINEAGEREFIDEDRRQTWIAEAEAEIAKNCR